MSLMWMPPQTTMPPLRHRPQRGGHELAGRREDERGVELLGRRAERVARPLGAQLEREGLRGRRRPRAVKANTRRPWWRATWQTMCAAAPKP